MEELLLEYRAESGNFHYNPVRNGSPRQEPNTFGWESIAYSTEDKVSIFTDIMCIWNHKRQKENKPFLTVDEVKTAWREYCYCFNRILRGLCKMDKKQFQPHLEKLEDWNMTRAIAELGNPHFSDTKEDNGWGDTLDYDPFNFFSSNF